jgi:hypothetical protein
VSDDQRAALEALVCERFSATTSNKKILETFENEKGSLLITYANERGFGEDERGDTAFYIVKTRAGHGLFFFSLKCGELFHPLKEDEMRASMAESLVLSQAVLNIVSSVANKKKMAEELKALGLSKGMTIEELLKVFGRDKSIKNVLNRLEQDIRMEPNTNVARVARTFSGIQLVHFCANRNESVMRIWDESGMRRPMGEVLFWQFVAPLFLKIRTFVGCEYAFLFAADMSPDLSLIHYYEQALRFMQDASIGANKPAYDFCCSFMCQPLRELAKNRKNYFEHFNDKVM